METLEEAQATTNTHRVLWEDGARPALDDSSVLAKSSNSTARRHESPTGAALDGVSRLCSVFLLLLFSFFIRFFSEGSVPSTKWNGVSRKQVELIAYICLTVRSKLESEDRPR